MVNLSVQEVRYGQAMAAVLDAIIPYVKNLIAGMAEEEVNTLLGVSGEITNLAELPKMGEQAQGCHVRRHRHPRPVPTGG